MVAALVGLALGCGNKAPVPSPPRPTPTPPLAAVDGTWQWSSESIADGVIIVESEWWLLNADEGELAGSYDRRVEFRTVSGEAFACSQSPAFALETHYSLVGARDSEGAIVREVTADPLASPCQRSAPALATYEAALAGDELRLHGAGRDQRLVRTTAAAVLRPAATVDGEWTWSATSIGVDGAVRRELETWKLEAVDGEIRGGYERLVTLESAAGPLACDGVAATAAATDRYELRGHNRPSGIELSEIRAFPGEHKCFPSIERHLDAASGTLYRDHLVLEWRGNRRQVLSRP